MGRGIERLSDLEVRQAKPKDKEYSLADGGNLYLRVKTTGSKVWVLNYYRPATKQRANIGLGSYPDVSLEKARKEAKALRVVLGEGIDPKEHREDQEREKTEQYANTFEHIARNMLTLKKGKVSPAYHDKITGRLEKYIFPKMGKTPIHKVSAATTIGIITPLATDEKLETVKKICRWINEVMIYAVNTGVAHANPLSGIGKAFSAPKVTNLPTLRPDELPALMYAIQHSNTKLVTRCLIEWQMHTMVRPGEAAGTRWDEIDREKKEWTIPAERMKKNKPHIVPLSEQALKLLTVLNPVSGHREFVFPSDHNPRKSANSQSANRALARMGFHGRLVSHGLRALASTTLNETGFDSDVIEAALAHVDKNSVRAAYNRAHYLERRRKMMGWWSDHIEQCASGKMPHAQGKRHLAILTPDNMIGIPKPDTDKINIDNKKQRGGPRQGAGRKKEVTFTKKLALVNEVTLLQRQQPGLTQEDALNKLKSEKKIKLQYRRTYLTPAHFSKEAKKILLESEREGILSVLPRLTEKDPL